MHYPRACSSLHHPEYPGQPEREASEEGGAEKAKGSKATVGLVVRRLAPYRGIGGKYPFGGGPKRGA